MLSVTYVLVVSGKQERRHAKRVGVVHPVVRAVRIPGKVGGTTATGAPPEPRRSMSSRSFSRRASRLTAP